MYSKEEYLGSKINHVMKYMSLRANAQDKMALIRKAIDKYNEHMDGELQLKKEELMLIMAKSISKLLNGKNSSEVAQDLKPISSQ